MAKSSGEAGLPPVYQRRWQVERSTRARRRQRVGAVEAGSVSTGPEFINVIDYNVDRTDTQASAANNKECMDRAIAAAIAAGRDIYFPAGTYWFGSAPIVEAATGLRFFGNGNVVIRYPSSDETLTSNSDYDSDSANRRSAFYVRNSTDVWFEGLRFRGNDEETDININTGIAISVRNTSGLRVVDCVNLYGAGLVNQTDQANDFGAVVSGCRSYGARKNCRLGAGGTFIDCVFELPNTASYDRVGDDGSSHAIYHYAASGDHLSVIGCTFKYIRKDCVKMSGSASACKGVIVQGCRFIECGKNSDNTLAGGAGIVFGADDTTEHAELVVDGNQFSNCAAAVDCYGARSVVITGNSISIDTVHSGSAGTAHISVSKYDINQRQVEHVLIANNVISAKPSIGGSNISGIGIKISMVGVTSTDSASATTHSSVKVSGNTIAWAATTGISSTRCIMPQIIDNTFDGLTTAITLSGDMRPVVSGVYVANQQSNNAQIKQTNVSWPAIDVTRNIGSGRLNTIAGRVQIGNNSGGTTPVRYPLLGFSGYSLASGSLPELVFAYGDGWVSGDTIDFNGTTLTYGTSFTSVATLITAINALGGGTTYTATDYGSTWSVTTNHIKVRRQSTSTTANLFYIKRGTIKHPTACVLLENYSLLQDRTYSRGENADYVVAWSPCYHLERPPVMLPENSDAQTAMNSSTPLRVVSEAGDDSASCTFSIGGLTGTETFTWRF